MLHRNRKASHLPQLLAFRLLMQFALVWVTGFEPAASTTPKLSGRFLPISSCCRKTLQIRLVIALAGISWVQWGFEKSGDIRGEISDFLEMILEIIIFHEGSIPRLRWPTIHFAHFLIFGFQSSKDRLAHLFSEISKVRYSNRFDNISLMKNQLK